MDAPAPPPADPVAPPAGPVRRGPGPVRVTIAVAVLAVLGTLVALSGVGRGDEDVAPAGSRTPSGPSAPTTSATAVPSATSAGTPAPTPAATRPELCSALVTAQLLRGRASVGPGGALDLEPGTLSCGDGTAQIRTMRVPLDRESGELIPKVAGTYGRGTGVVVAVPHDLGRCESLVTFAATSTDVPDPQAVREEVFAVVAADTLEKAGTTVVRRTSAIVAVTVTGRASSCRPTSVSVPEASRADCWSYDRRSGTATGGGCAKGHNAEVFAVSTARYSDYSREVNGPDLGLEPVDRDETWPDWSARTAAEFCDREFDDLGLRPGTRKRDVEQVTIYPTTPLPAGASPLTWDGGGQIVCLAVLRGDRTATKRFLAISR